MNLLDQLKSPFPVNRIRWRVGATKKDKTQGIALAYVDARDVMRRLDEVCGLDWQCRYSHVTEASAICDIGIKIEGDWLWRSNGAGETAIEGKKGAMSDAFKRAAVLWGVGRYLYSLPTFWVLLKEKGNSHVLDQIPSMPAWGTPEGYAARLEPDYEAPPEVVYVERHKYDDDSTHLTLLEAKTQCADSIVAIKKGIGDGDTEGLASAAEAYFELSIAEMTALNIAPSKNPDAPFTTYERGIFKTKEFREAHYGTEASA